MLIDLLNKRCSVRQFIDKQIPDEVVDYILEAGRLSPSGGNEQSWKFGVISDKELIGRISEIAYNQSWIAKAPLLIVLCTIIVDDERGGRHIQKRRFPNMEQEIENMDKMLYSNLNSEEHQTKIPGTHMVLAGLEKGVYSTWISYFEVDKLRDLLKLPDTIIPSEIIAFGYSDSNIQSRNKKSIEEVVFYNQYN